MPELTTREQYNEMLSKYGTDAMDLAVKAGATNADPTKSQAEKDKANAETKDNARKICQGAGAAAAAIAATSACTALSVATAGALSWTIPFCTGIGATLGAVLGGWIFDGISGLFAPYKSGIPFCDTPPLGAEHLTRHCAKVVTFYQNHAQANLVQNEYTLFKCFADSGVVRGPAYETSDVNNVLRYNLFASHHTNAFNGSYCQEESCIYQPIRFAYHVFIKEGVYQKLKDGDKAAVNCAKISPKTVAYLLQVSLTLDETIKKGGYTEIFGEISWVGWSKPEGVGGNPLLNIDNQNKAFAELEKSFEKDYNAILKQWGVWLEEDKKDSVNWWWWLFGGVGLLFLIGLIIFLAKKKGTPKTA